MLTLHPTHRAFITGQDVMQGARFDRRLSILPTQLGNVGEGLTYKKCLADLQRSLDEVRFTLNCVLRPKLTDQSRMRQ